MVERVVLSFTGKMKNVTHTQLVEKPEGEEPFGRGEL
jgi:hypothetical protein